MKIIAAGLLGLIIAGCSHTHVEDWEFFTDQKTGLKMCRDRSVLEAKIYYGRVVTKYSVSFDLDTIDYYFLVRFAPYENQAAEGETEHLKIDRLTYEKADPSRVPENWKRDKRWRYGVMVRKEIRKMKDGCVVVSVDYIFVLDDIKK